MAQTAARWNTPPRPPTSPASTPAAARSRAMRRAAPSVARPLGGRPDAQRLARGHTRAMRRAAPSVARPLGGVAAQWPMGGNSKPAGSVRKTMAAHGVRPTAGRFALARAWRTVRSRQTQPRPGPRSLQSAKHRQQQPRRDHQHDADLDGQVASHVLQIGLVTRSAPPCVSRHASARASARASDMPESRRRRTQLYEMYVAEVMARPL